MANSCPDPLENALCAYVSPEPDYQPTDEGQAAAGRCLLTAANHAQNPEPETTAGRLEAALVTYQFPNLVAVGCAKDLARPEAKEQADFGHDYPNLTGPNR